MRLERFSLGVGDRFGRQAEAQLQAFVRAAAAGAPVTPVWNKSHREHTLVGSHPDETRRAADAAVRALGWRGAYGVDADHIGLANVERFLAACDYFTLDVADWIGRPPPAAELEAFVRRHGGRLGALELPGGGEPLRVGRDALRAIGGRYLAAVKEAGRIYRRLAAAKGPDAFVVELSLDETDAPQSPVELLFILAAAADEGLPLRTVAPKFTGRFNKGVDYAGDVPRFARQFEDDLRVVAYAVREFGLPADLKLSVHSGSDKFSLYGPMRAALRRQGAGLHLKTAGTTWLAELEGLAAAGGEGLRLAQDIYRQAFERFDECCGPYAAVIAIRRAALPPPAAVAGWSSAEFVAALRHDPGCARFDPNLRQLLHVGYKVAAEMGVRFLDALREHRQTIAERVTENIYTRHIAPLFL